MGSHTIHHNIKMVEHPPNEHKSEYKKPEITSQPTNNDNYFPTKNQNGFKNRSNSYDRNDSPYRQDNYFHSRNNSQITNQHQENLYHDKKNSQSQFSTLPRRVTSTGVPGPHFDYYPSKNLHDRRGFSSSFDFKDDHYQSQPLKSKDYSPRGFNDDFGFTDSNNYNKSVEYHGNDTGNIEEIYDRQIKMSRSMSAIPINGMRYKDQAYYYPPTDYTAFNSTSIKPSSNRRHIEDVRTYSSNKQQSGALPTYQYSNSGVGGGGHYHHSSNRYDNYHESSYGTKGRDQMIHDQQSIPYGQSNMLSSQQHERSKQFLNKSAKFGNRQSRSHSTKRQNKWASSGTAANNGYFDQNAIIGYDKDGRPIRKQKHYKINCCCFSFKWPLWTVEPCPPPQRMYGSSNYDHTPNGNIQENFKDNNLQPYPSRHPYN
uniref:ZM domain-containing protein n=1 Tax=Strongyloides papillosus TaxID=174720 RepID=A0A0N5BUB4_STREA